MGVQGFCVVIRLDKVPGTGSICVFAPTLFLASRRAWVISGTISVKTQRCSLHLETLRSVPPCPPAAQMAANGCRECCDSV